MARRLGSATMANDDSTIDIYLNIYMLVKPYSEGQIPPRLEGWDAGRDPVVYSIADDDLLVLVVRVADRKDV